MPIRLHSQFPPPRSKDQVSLTHGTWRHSRSKLPVSSALSLAFACYPHASLLQLPTIDSPQPAWPWIIPPDHQEGPLDSNYLSQLWLHHGCGLDYAACCGMAWVVTAEEQSNWRQSETEKFMISELKGIQSGLRCVLWESLSTIFQSSGIHIGPSLPYLKIKEIREQRKSEIMNSPFLNDWGINYSRQNNCLKHVWPLQMFFGRRGANLVELEGKRDK